MWLHYPGATINGEDYRTLRICTNFLAFGTPDAYRNAYFNANKLGKAQGSTLGMGDLLYRSAPRAQAGPTIGTVDWTPTTNASVVGTCYKYNVWCFDEKELYDLALDPYEVNNRWGICTFQLAICSMLIPGCGCACRAAGTKTREGGRPVATCIMQKARVGVSINMPPIDGTACCASTEAQPAHTPASRQTPD